MDNNRVSNTLPKLWASAKAGAVGEHSGRLRREAVRLPGASGKEDVGISNDNADEKSAHRNPQVS